MALNEVWKPSYDGGAEILEGIKISFHHVQRVEDNFSPSHQKVTTVPVRTTAFPLRRGKDSEDDSPFFLAMEGLSCRRRPPSFPESTDGMKPEWNGVAISATSSGYGQEFKLEISVGTVNVANQITGMNKQDYFVVSDESLWVDGVSIDLERVRQFVALGPSTKYVQSTNLIPSAPLEYLAKRVTK